MGEPHLAVAHAVEVAVGLDQAACGEMPSASSRLSLRVDAHDDRRNRNHFGQAHCGKGKNA